MTRSVRVQDLSLAEKLTAELDQIVLEAKETLVTGLPFEKYQQACGMIEAFNQVRNGLIPRLVEELQKG